MMLGDDRALTGLESAIVLIAFVVVASVFAYVVIGSGLFAAQKSREVVSGAVDQTTSILMTAGSGSKTIQPGVSEQGNHLLTISISLKLPSYSSPIDLNRTKVRLTTNRTINNSIFFPEQGTTVQWPMSKDTPPDMLLESGEVVQLYFTDLDLPPATACTITVMPPQGMPLSISMTMPK
ncbi:MAG: flagellin [Methanocella sp. PtaU1.Bin125]|nr:MAG: flagellin [Methanocella sp. PtaU1.Bin125]